MKKKNAKIWVVIIISVQFLVLCSVMTNANAWKNGKQSTGTFNPYNPDALVEWRSSGKYYGTHDWIAEAALDAIRQDQHAQQWKDSEGLDFWNERRTVIFLIGTEAPDMSSSQVKMTLNNMPVSGHKTVAKHNMRFVEDDIDKYGENRRMKTKQTNVLDLLGEYEPKAMVALIDGNCDLAAFYMGYIAHLIADLSSWGHVIDSWDILWTWSQYQEEIDPPDTESKRKALLRYVHDEYERDVLSYTRNRNEGRFTYPKNFRVSPNGIKNLREIATELAFKTRFDYPATRDEIDDPIIPSHIQEGDHNALWMFHQSCEIDLMTNKYHYVKIRNQNGLQGRYYIEKVQEHLNDGVKAVAKVLDYFGQRWNTETNRKCTGCGTEKAQETSMNMSRKMMIGVTLFLYMGVAASFFQAIIVMQLQSAMRKEKSIVPI